jgi:chitinase domain-containing protein 1
MKKFPGQVLAYVTPWNRKGYDLAVTFRSKLTHVSPVWYQLRRDKTLFKGAHTHGFHLDGGHEVNQTWIKAVRAKPEGHEVRF